MLKTGDRVQVLAGMHAGALGHIIERCLTTHEAWQVKLDYRGKILPYDADQIQVWPPAKPLRERAPEIQELVDAIRRETHDTWKPQDTVCELVTAFLDAHGYELAGLPEGLRAVPVGAGLAGYPERVADLVAKGRGYGQTGGTL